MKMKRKEIFIETKNWNEQFYSKDGFENSLFLFIIIFFNSISFKIQEKKYRFFTYNYYTIYPFNATCIFKTFWYYRHNNSPWNTRTSLNDIHLLSHLPPLFSFKSLEVG